MDLLLNVKRNKTDYFSVSIYHLSNAVSTDFEV